MAPATTGGGLSVVTERRLALAGEPGLKGLVSNLHTLSIAFFASIGGLVYGYNQGKSTSACLHRFSLGAFLIIPP